MCSKYLTFVYDWHVLLTPCTNCRQHCEFITYYLFLGLFLPKLPKYSAGISTQRRTLHVRALLYLKQFSLWNSAGSLRDLESRCNWLPCWWSEPTEKSWIAELSKVCQGILLARKLQNSSCSERERLDGKKAAKQLYTFFSFYPKHKSIYCPASYFISIRYINEK